MILLMKDANTLDPKMRRMKDVNVVVRIENDLKIKG
jgi:hypothetical protein